MSKLKIDSRMYRLKGLTPILGSLPASRAVLTEYIASKAPAEDAFREEVDNSIDVEDRLTVFARNPNNQLCVMGYQLKGFFKSALQALRGQVNIAAFKSKIDLMVFVDPRFIPLKQNGQPCLFEDSINERPLRYDSPRGEKMTLAASEQINDPWSIDVEISLLPSKSSAKSDALTWEIIETALDYGAYHGLGQWRNADYGRFIWERIED